MGTEPPSLGSQTTASASSSPEAPSEWLSGWVNGETPESDTPENMALAVAAVGLIAEQRGSDAQLAEQSAAVRLTSV
jgi:hypothetical protein